MADKAAGQSGGIKPDISSILGVLIALGGILGGLVLEDGKSRGTSRSSPPPLSFWGAPWARS